MSKGIYPVDIHCKHIIWSTKGYYDTGNTLKDPYTGRGVHIISRSLFNRLHLSEVGKVCIPYQALGNQQGLIDVYYVEALKIHKNGEKVECPKVPLGVADDSLFAGKVYEMILNEEV